jgi:hypothetical protein
MSIQEVLPEQLARLFHHYHQSLAPECLAHADQTPAWQDVPLQERARFVSAARLALLELATIAKEQEENRRYFAKPGEAEWGC